MDRPAARGILVFYATTLGLAIAVSVTAVALADSVVWAWAARRAGTVWPAVWFHTAHNLVSQFLFPAFFSGAEKELLLGEDGLFPTLTHLAAMLVLVAWLRRAARAREPLEMRSTDGRGSAR